MSGHLTAILVALGSVAAVLIADAIEGAVFRWSDRRRERQRRDLLADAHREHRQ